MSTRARLVDELLKLPASERAEAARTLLESLDPGDAGGAEAAWNEEIAARVAQIEGGDVDLEDGPTVMRHLRDQANARLGR